MPPCQYVGDPSWFHRSPRLWGPTRPGPSFLPNHSIALPCVSFLQCVFLSRMYPFAVRIPLPIYIPPHVWISPLLVSISPVSLPRASSSPVSLPRVYLNPMYVYIPPLVSLSHIYLSPLNVFCCRLYLL